MTQEDFNDWAEKQNIQLTNSFEGCKKGDIVNFTNDYGIIFGPYTIMGIGVESGISPLHPNNRIYLDYDCFWFPARPDNLTPINLK